MMSTQSKPQVLSARSVRCHVTEPAEKMEGKTGEKRHIRLQFMTNVLLPSSKNVTMMISGCLPELGSWGCLLPMKKLANGWYYDVEIELEEISRRIIDFSYRYSLFRTSAGKIDKMKQNESTDAIWESTTSRCKLDLETLLDHTRSTTDDENQNVKIIFQANGIDFCDGTDLYMIGNLPVLGNLDLKKARKMKKMVSGGYCCTLFVSPKASLKFWYSWIQNPDVLFGNDDVLHKSSIEPAMLWNSGIGRISSVEDTPVVVHLFDKWDVASELKGVSTPLAERKMNKQKSDDRLACKVCWVEESQMAFVPCGHAVTCWGCSLKVRRCPICREAIKERMRIFVS